jgi:atypical dual specificity phosphatase
MPPGFTWIDRPYVAALAMPRSAEDLAWLRRSGIEVLVSLSEDPPPRHWINDAGLMLVHVPVVDMTAPTLEQLEVAIDAIDRANRSGLAAAVHCTAGLGRTGTVLAAYFVFRGMRPEAAIEKVRELRPGSVETLDQERVVEEYSDRRNGER